MMLEIESPLDMHLHLRQDDMLERVAPFSANHFSGAVIMPNLIAPVDNLDRVHTYRKAIQTACGDQVFTPYMTLFFRTYSKKELIEARKEIIGIKLYPAGITTQSEAGVADFDAIAETVALMEELNIPLLVHAESNGFVLEREREFLKVLQWLAETFPRLHLIVEHITTAEAVEFINKYTNVSATVTLHHLLITLDDVVGGLMQPDLFCKPIAKTPRDREALGEAVLSGHDRIMFGSDSAPHPRHKKECCGCAAGVFSAPVALPLLAQFFEDADRLDLLPGFVSTIAQQRYNIEPPQKTLRLERISWQVPEYYHDIRPFWAGKELRWSVTR